jgi:glycerol-3-phosphate acyltransferase PlsX
MRIALDALGGDLGPLATVDGAYQYVKENPADTVVLTGDTEKIREELKKIPAAYHKNLPIVHAPENISMSESPTEAVKKKKASSMVVGLTLQKNGEADGFVSAGNTGAQLAASLLILGRIPEVKRPVIGTFLPSEKGMVFVVDAGANVDSKPLHLLQFAIMGNIFVSQVFGKKSLKIGLLSIGEEPTKGNETTLVTHKLFKEHLPNFYGNVEGGDILKCTTDIVICDGFVGNITLKMVESVMGVITNFLKDHVSGKPLRSLGSFLMQPAFRELKNNFNYEVYGGVPLLGVNGISIICHGKSTALAIKNALRVARDMKEKEVNLHIEQQLKAEKIVET